MCWLVSFAVIRTLVSFNMEDSIMSETRRDVSNLMEFDIKGSGHFVRLYNDNARNIHIYRRTLPRDGGE